MFRTVRPRRARAVSEHCPPTARNSSDCLSADMRRLVVRTGIMDHSKGR